ncbi:MAG TPA: phosphatase PAP2 family protein [Opitutus sp.]|nr:phosphatase PAP2 family protein [Opitutus sp.]
MKRWDALFWPAAALLLGTIALFELTSLDLRLQDELYDFDAHRWMVDGTDAGPRFWFYDAPKIAIIGIGVLLIVLVCGPERWRRGIDRRAMLVAILTLASVPALVGVGKATTNVFCPSEIRRYGGDVPYVQLCGSYPAADRPLRKGRCFPAGHASGGFALISLAGLARTARGRWFGAAVGLMAGGTMGFYQMAKGAHYLSHTLVTALVAWWMFLLWRRIIGVKSDT